MGKLIRLPQSHFFTPPRLPLVRGGFLPHLKIQRAINTYKGDGAIYKNEKSEEELPQIHRLKYEILGDTCLII